MLSFDAATHTYRFNGAVVPNVTKILAPMVDLSMVPADALENARQEGVAIHRMVELDCKGDLDVASLPEWMKPRHAAWCKFKEDSGVEVWAAEEKIYHPMGYAGTPDIIGCLPKFKRQAPAVIDVKRSLFAGPAIGLQTAAYREAWNRKHKDMKAENRYALQLRENGTYRLEPYDDPDDWTAFLALLTTYRWRQKHGRA